MDWHKQSAILIIVTAALSGCATKGTSPFGSFFANRELAESEPYAADASARAKLASVGQDRRAAMPGSGDRNAVTLKPGNTAARDTESVRLASSKTMNPSARAASYTAQPSLVVLGDEKQFSNLMQGAEGPVVLDFFTTWCGPCKKQSQILHQMEPVAHEKGATIIKVDAEKFPRIAKQFGVKAYPTLVAVKDGGIAQRQTGVADAKTLERWFSL